MAILWEARLRILITRSLSSRSFHSTAHHPSTFVTVLYANVLTGPPFFFSLSLYEGHSFDREGWSAAVRFPLQALLVFLLSLKPIVLLWSGVIFHSSTEPAFVFLMINGWPMSHQNTGSIMIIWRASFYCFQLKTVMKLKCCFFFVTRKKQNSLW